MRAAPGGGKAGSFARAALPLGLSQLLVVGSARINTLVLASVGRLRDAAAFESGWRMFQVLQYLGGGVASAMSPVFATAVGVGAKDDARRLATRATWCLLAAGSGLALALWFLAPTLAVSLFPEQRNEVRPVLRALALTVPLSLAAAVAAGRCSPPSRPSDAGYPPRSRSARRSTWPGWPPSRTRAAREP